MKLLIINGIYGSRSSGRSIADIKSEMENNGHKVFVATPEYYEGDDFYRIGNTFDHKIHAVLSRVVGKQAYFSKFATKRLINYIEKIKPDVIHIQVIHGNFLNFKMLTDYVAKKGIPMVFVLDDCWYFTGKCCHYIADKCYKWQSGCENCPRKKADNPSLFFDFSRSMYNDKKRAFEQMSPYAVVAVSDWLKNEASKSYLKNADILKRVYNALDLDIFKYKEECLKVKEKLGLKDKKVILGVATEWADKGGLSKGINLFIDLASKIDADTRILLVGKMDSSINLPDNIISIDFVDGANELAKYYSFADVFVQMSSEETFGKVTAEALSCGTPVIVFNSTANPELVGENCGYVVENKNVDAVLEKILKIFNDGKDKYSNFCRKFAEENFDKKQNAKAFFEIYNELLNKRKLRIAQINSTTQYSTGGLALSIHKRALDTGHESLFIYNIGKSDVPKTKKIGNIFDRKIHALLSRITGLQGYFSHFKTKRVIRALKKFSPDIVHIHIIHSNDMNINMLFKYLAKRNIAVCLTLHDCFMFTGHCCYYTDVECQKWKTDCGNCPLKRKFNISWFFDTSKYVLNNKKQLIKRIENLAVIGVSNWVLSEAKLSILKDAKISTVVYNWIDQNVFYPKETQKPDNLKDSFIILGVAKDFNNLNGIDDFIKLSGMLSENEKIVLIGKCNKKLPKNIISVGPVKDKNELSKWYNIADVFVSASKSETFGLVTAEAISCGTPAVVYNTTASPELVGTYCGYVCENGNVDDLYKKIKLIKSNGKASYSKACVDFSQVNFSEQKNVDKYFDVYKKLLNK